MARRKAREAARALAPAPPLAPAAARREGLALLGLAAVALVMANRYQPRFLFYPVHGFHLGLLFFGAGRLASAGDPTEARGRALGREAGILLGAFVLGTLVLGGASLALAAGGLAPPGVEAGAPAPAALGRWLAAPFTGAAGPDLFPAGWVLVALAAAGALGRFAAAWPVAGPALLAALGVLGTVAGADEASRAGDGPWVVLARTAFACLFVALGHLAGALSARARRALLSPGLGLAAFAAADVLAANTGGFAYALERGDLGLHPGARLLVTGAIVLLVFQVTARLAPRLGERGALLALGRALPWVIALHAAVMFGLNLGVHLAGLVPAGDLARAGFAWRPNQAWLAYLGLGLALPAIFSSAAARAAARIVALRRAGRAPAPAGGNR